jgi:hypothetical protein
VAPAEDLARVTESGSCAYGAVMEHRLGSCGHENLAINSIWGVSSLTVRLEASFTGHDGIVSQDLQAHPSG